MNGEPAARAEGEVGLAGEGAVGDRSIEAPRVSLPYETQGLDHPSALTVNIEGRIDPAVVAALEARGHIANVKASWDPFFGGMQGVCVHANGALSGGADPRRDGVAMGY